MSADDLAGEVLCLEEGGGLYAEAGPKASPGRSALAVAALLHRGQEGAERIWYGGDGQSRRERAAGYEAQTNWMQASASADGPGVAVAVVRRGHPSTRALQGGARMPAGNGPHPSSPTGAARVSLAVDGTPDGAFALIAAAPDRLGAARDPRGLKPLFVGMLDGGVAFASESSVLEGFGATAVRALAPGVLYTVRPSDDGTWRLSERRYMPGVGGGESGGTLCSFELVYFSRPDSAYGGRSVYAWRRALGAALAEDGAPEADVVIGVPDSGTVAAVGYAEASGLRLELGLIKNRYVGRTYIAPTESVRRLGVRQKLSAVREAVEGRRVVLIDDSIVRGTTIERVVRLLRMSGAAAVHVRVAAPPVVAACPYGVERVPEAALFARRVPPEQMAAALGVDSLEFLSLERYLDVLRSTQSPFCAFCFGGPRPKGGGAHG